jgi:hypothetical protein
MVCSHYVYTPVLGERATYSHQTHEKRSNCGRLRPWWVGLCDYAPFGRELVTKPLIGVDLGYGLLIVDLLLRPWSV